MMKMPTRRLAIACALAAALASGPGVQAAAFDPSQSDEKAVTIADQVLKTIGSEAFGKVRFLKFRYTKVQGEEVVEERVHIWDRETKRSHLETFTTKTRKPVVVIVDHATGQGQATLEGQQLTGENGDKIVADAKNTSTRTSCGSSLRSGSRSQASGCAMKGRKRWAPSPTT
jgi:hypothetical protein